MGPTLIPVRVVLDTNTLVSALFFQSKSWSWLREAWKSRRIRPIVCRETTLEFLTVLAYPKFKLSKEEQEALRSDFLPYAEVCRTTGESGLAPCRDPKDQIFLELAFHGKADFLLSGDGDLLGPTDFAARLAKTAEGHP